MQKIWYALFVPLLLFSCATKKESPVDKLSSNTPTLTLTQANLLAQLPLTCLEIEYPNKPNETLSNKGDLDEPHVLHPAFYGCFDWHSSVDGHWSLIFLIKKFPTLEQTDQIQELLARNLSQENIAIELAYFEKAGNASFERTYGWAWVLKLAQELHTWDTPLARRLEQNLQPLTDYMVNAYINFFPKLQYPIRVGEHTNTAYGLSFAFDYANTVGNESLILLIKESVQRFYASDKGCPISWEPNGFDFLSPCLEEANLVRKVYPPDDFNRWLKDFLPQLTEVNFTWSPGIVKDRTDGKLVHLDGLNFSRASCLYGIAQTVSAYGHLTKIADQHVAYSLPNLLDDNYEGTHWLGTFALHALNESRKTEAAEEK
jgi:hypothetical protein